MYQSALIPELSQIEVPQLSNWPSISMVIPACNEETTIESALLRVLDIDYPNIQIIVVNDRSTDQTGEIINRIAQSYPQIQVIHISTLPQGWLGKINALHRGTQLAQGEYLIYADADIHFHPQCFKRAIAYADHYQLDYLSAIPCFHGKSWILRSLIFAFSGLFIATTRLGSVNRDRKGAYGGVGVFQMIRTRFFQETPGWAWLKLEIGDDMAMAMMCHVHHARARFVRASELISLTWYPSVSALIKGLEKNSFPVAMRFSILRSITLCSFVLCLVLSPWCMIASGELYVGFGFIMIQTMMLLAIPAMGASWVERILSPFFFPLLIFIIVRSMWVTIRQGGVRWRGTFYSVEELKKGQRLKW